MNIISAPLVIIFKPKGAACHHLRAHDFSQQQRCTQLPIISENFWCGLLTGSELQVTHMSKMRLSTSEVTAMLTRVSLQASVLRDLQSTKATAQKASPPPEADSLAKLQLFPDFPPAGNREAGNALRSAQSADLDSTAAAIRRCIAGRRLNVSVFTAHIVHSLLLL